MKKIKSLYLIYNMFKLNLTSNLLYLFQTLYFLLFLITNPFLLILLFGRIFGLNQLLALFFVNLIILSVFLFCFFNKKISNSKKILFFLFPLLLSIVIGNFINSSQQSIQSEAIIKNNELSKFNNYVNNNSNTNYRFENLYLINPVSYNYKNMYSVEKDNSTGVNIRSSTNYNSTGDEIWFFGGSTMYSRATSNDYTIPSLFAKIANKNKNKIIVKNFGISGFNTSLELLNFIELLKRTKNFPKAVVFYDGFNDSVSRLSYDEVPINLREAMNYFGNNSFKAFGFYFVKLLNEQNYFFRELLGNKLFYGYFLNFKEFNTSESDIDSAAKIYNQNIRLISSISNLYNIEHYFFLQPMPFTKLKLSEEEENRKDDLIYKSGLKVYKKIIDENSKNKNFINISDVFNSNSNTLYIDSGGHVHNEGNQLVSVRIYKEIKKRTEFLK